jgi:hypothetical protein
VTISFDDWGGTVAEGHIRQESIGKMINKLRYVERRNQNGRRAIGRKYQNNLLKNIWK